MTSVQSKQDIDVALFADFMAESIEKFNEFRKLGKAYTKNKIAIRAINNLSSIPSDDPMGSQFLNQFSVVNFRQTTFREVLPNMDGAIRAKAQTYGMAMFSILPGRHTPQLVDYHVRGVKCTIQLTCLQSSGGDVIEGRYPLFNSRITEIFDGACIKGFERDENINHLFIRFNKHQLTTRYFGENGVCLGASSAFTADYAQAITMAQAQN